MRYSSEAIASATRAMCRELYGDNFDLHDHGAQDPEGRAGLERAAEAAVEAYLEQTGTKMRNLEWVKELEALRANAMPGDWAAKPVFNGATTADVVIAGTENDTSTGDGYVFVDSEGLIGCAELADAQYVAALHNALPNLLALIRARVT
jgi:hypothetical protein